MTPARNPNQHGAWDLGTLGPGTLGPGTWDRGPGTLGPGTLGPLGPWYLVPGTRDHIVITFFIFEAAQHIDNAALAFVAIVFLLNLSITCAWARVYNGDHTVQQVTVSFALGTLLGLVGYLVDRKYFHDAWLSTESK